MLPLQKHRCAILSVLASTLGGSLFAAPSVHHIKLSPIGTYESGIFAQGAAEIVAHDPATQRLFVVNAQAAALDVLDINDPTNPTKVGGVSFSTVI
jgi:hypothetical protein